MNAIRCPFRGFRAEASGAVPLFGCLAISTSRSFVYCSLCSDRGGFSDAVWLRAMKTHLPVGIYRNTRLRNLDVPSCDRAKAASTTKHRRGLYFKSYSTTKDSSGDHLSARVSNRFRAFVRLSWCHSRFFSHIPRGDDETCWPDGQVMGGTSRPPRFLHSDKTLTHRGNVQRVSMVTARPVSC